MDRNQVIGLLLIVLVFFGYGKWKQSQAEAMAAEQQKVESPASESTFGDSPASERESNFVQKESSTTQTELDSSEQARIQKEAESRFESFYISSTGDEEKVQVETETMKAIFSTKGGVIESLNLKGYQTHDSLPLLLFDERSDLSFRFRTKKGNILHSRDMHFQAVTGDLSLTGEESKQFVMRLSTTDPNKYVDYIYTFKGQGYDVDFDINIHGLEQVLDVNYGILMEWDMTGISSEKSRSFEDQVCSVFYRYTDEDRDYLSETSDDEEELSTTTSWVAFKQTFFSAIAISETGFPKDEGQIGVKKTPKENWESSDVTKYYTAKLTVPMKSSTTGGFQFYFGPNDYQILAEKEMDLGKVVNIGWGIFGWMNKWLVIPIFKFLEGKNLGGYGIIILILTFIIKMLLLPLTYKNYLSSAKMKALKPEIEELNKKFEGQDDPMKKQQAQMALYRSTGVNPMAGCVPMLIQMPILYAMFRFFPSSIELRQQSFLWAEDLSSYDSILNLPFEIPFYGAHVSLFTLLMAASTIFYTRMNSANMPASQPGMPNMKTLMYIFPVMMLFFFNSYSSGLSLYYLTANVMSMGQMYLIKNVVINEDKLRAQIIENKKKPRKKSKFQQRLEDMQKQQQAQMKGGAKTKQRKGSNKKKKKKK